MLLPKPRAAESFAVEWFFWLFFEESDAACFGVPACGGVSEDGGDAGTAACSVGSSAKSAFAGRCGHIKNRVGKSRSRAEARMGMSPLEREACERSARMTTANRRCGRRFAAKRNSRWNGHFVGRGVVDPLY
jgi:hypothetical protein